MKQFSFRRAATALLATVLMVSLALLVPGGTLKAQQTTNGGTLVIALTGAPPTINLPYTPAFQSLSFNVLAVKLNPGTNPDILTDQSDPNWVTIPVAQGVGLNDGGTVDVYTQLANLFNTNTTGPNPQSAGTGPSELQVDMNQIQTVPQLFNSEMVPAETYHLIELELDGSNAGTAVPICLENASSLLEGCIASQIAMVNPSQFLGTTSLGGISVPLGGLTTMVINITPLALPGIPNPPSFSGGFYTFNPIITVLPQTPNTLGQVTGSAFRATQVAAELAGTGQVVETTTLSNAAYQLPLPASTTGTLYDLVASGGGEYAIAHNVLVKRNHIQNIQLDQAPSSGHVSLAGKVTDACSGMALQGATLEILAPAPGSGADCTQLPTPTDCVVLASANTDDAGDYPLSSSNFVLQSFTSVSDGNYTMRVTDAGYDTVASTMTINGGGAVCSLGKSGTCNFALGRSTVEGLVTISPPVPSPRALNVMVTAEDHGTHHIENVTLASVPVGSSAAPFTMFVPDAGNVASLDMYATVSDYFNGLPEKASGHTIAVLSGLSSAGTCGTAATHPILAMQCAGHASIMGSTATFDNGTSIVLSKGGVQLMSTGLGPAEGTNPAQFSMCAPADPSPYQLQRFEASPPAAMPSPVASPTPIAMTSPIQIAQPCSSICSTGNGNCLVCTNQTKVVVP